MKYEMDAISQVGVLTLDVLCSELEVEGAVDIEWNERSFSEPLFGETGSSQEHTNELKSSGS